jgi:hypothetical protein
VLLIQASFAGKFNRTVELIDELGRVVRTETLYQGSTMCYFDLQTVYAGVYFVRVRDGEKVEVTKVVISR